jgi:hypothetical protein
MNLQENIDRLKQVMGVLSENKEDGQPSILREWTGTLLELRNDESLPNELNIVGKDILRQYPKLKTSKCHIDAIHYNENGSIRAIIADVYIVWKSYRKKNYNLQAYYRFNDGELIGGNIEKMW